MTKYTRLTSETSLIDYIKGLERKIDAQATKGSGSIIVADPETGVETVIGELPDGSVGFDQFVGDTTPPPVATTPFVSAQPGSFVVTWDGTFEGGAEKPRDFVHVNVIGHKMDGTTTVFSATLGVIRLVSESVLVNLDVAAGGESWQFSLESEDYTGNKAQWSSRSASYMMIDSISSTDQAWLDLNDEVAAKGKTFTQNVAPPVQEQLPQNLWIDTSAGPGLYVTRYWEPTANSGAGAWVALKDKDAKVAQDTADTKGRTYTQTTAPPVEARLPQNLWIDTSAGVNLSVTKFWDATANSGAGAWVPVKDAEINAAELRAAQDAKTKADAAQSAAINAQAYSYNPSFDIWTASAPDGYANYNVGPTKEASVFKNGPYSARFNCTDTTTNRGLSFSGIFGSSTPNLEYWTVEVTFQLVSGTSLSGAGVRLDWSGMTVPAGTQPTLQLATEVPTPATGKWYTVTKTLRRNPDATGTYTGMSGYLFANYNANGLGALSVKDIIFDWLNIRPATVGEILAYTAPTTSYVDQAKSDAITAASNDATTKANKAKADAIADTDTKLVGKNKIVWSPDPATGTSGYVAGDVWFQRDGTGATIGQWEFTTSWQPRTISDAVFGNISAGKITYGVLDGGLIGANTVTAKSLFIGDFTNLVTNGLGDLGDTTAWGPNFIYETTDKPAEVTGVFKTTAGQGTTSPSPQTFFAVDPSTEYTTEIWLKADKPNSRIYVELRDQAGAQGTTNILLNDGTSQGVYPLQNIVVPTVWTKYTIKSTTTATATKLRVGAIYFNHTNGTERGAVVSIAIAVRRRLGGTLLVDGAIDGKTITGATVQTEATANRGIKLTSSEFAGYDGSGNKNFSLTSGGTLTLKGSLQSGSTIAGATITGALETTATASRGVKLSNTGINAWDGSGNLTFSVDASTGLVKAPGLEANSITADKLAIGSGGNLFPDPTMMDWTAWSDTNTRFSAASGKSGNGSYLIPTSTTQIGAYYGLNYPTKRPRVVENGVYRVGAWVRTDVPAPSGSLQIYARAYNSGDSTWVFATAVGPVANNSAVTVSNTWTWVEGLFKIPAGYDTLVIGLFKQTSYTTGGARWSDPIIQQAMTGELVVDGSIDGKTITGATVQTATGATAGVKLNSSGISAYNSGGNLTFSVDAATGVVDAPGIRTNSLSGDKIIAKSMTLDKLILTSTDNLIMEGDFGNLGSAWQLNSFLTINSTAGRGSMPAMRLTATTTTQTSLNYNDRALNVKNKIAIGEDSRFRGSMWVKSTATAVAGSYKIVGRFYTTATAYSDITIASSPALAANVWTNVEGIVPATIPSGTIAAEFYLSLKNAATGTITDVDFVSVTRASTGSLIVDGAIDGKVITGATIQTAQSGSRIVLDDTSLNAWNTAGDNYFSVSDASGVNISSKGKAGYDPSRYNSCENPSFGLDISGWTSPQTISRDTGTKYNGTASLKATHTATADRTVTYKAFNNGYTAFYLSAYVRHNAATAKTITPKLIWTDSIGTTYSTVTGTGVSVAANTWTRISVTSTGVPAGSDYVKMDIVGTSFLSTETMWVDAVLFDSGSGAMTLKSYFDGDQARSGGYTYVWNGTAQASTSTERLDRNIIVKSGGNNVLDDKGLAALSPGVGFIRETPYTQTAGVFSDGQIVSLVEGTNNSPQSRVDIGNGKFTTWTDGVTTIESFNYIDIISRYGSISLSSNSISLMADTSIAGVLTADNGIQIGGKQVSTLEVLSPLMPSGWNIEGNFYIDKSSSGSRASMTIKVIRTGAAFSMPNTSYTTIGTIGPTTVRSTVGVQTYSPVFLNGGSAPINSTAFYNPSTGQVLIKPETTATVGTNWSFTFSHMWSL